jgi:hypothetical protein
MSLRFMSEGVSRLLRTDRNVFCRPSLSNIEHQLAGTEPPEYVRCRSADGKALCSPERRPPIGRGKAIGHCLYAAAIRKRNCLVVTIERENSTKQLQTDARMETEQTHKYQWFVLPLAKPCKQHQSCLTRPVTATARYRETGSCRRALFIRRWYRY